MRPLSLKSRLSLAIGSIVALATASVPVAIYIQMHKSLFHQTDQTLLTVAHGAAAIIDDEDTAAGRRADIQTLAGSTKTRRPTMLRVWPENSADVFFATNSPHEQSFWKNVLVRRPSEKTEAFFDAGEEGNEYRVLWLQSQTSLGKTNIAVAQSSHYAYEELARSLRLVVLSGAGAVLGSMLLVHVLVFWGLRPLRQTAEAMGGVTVTTVGDVRLIVDDVPVEVRPFVEATSAMLGRVNKTIQQQQQFAADASHELRTPLTLAMSTLQAARMRDRDVGAYKQALDEILEDLQHMDHLFSDLLVLSGMAETHGLASAGAVNLESLLQSVAEAFTFRITQTGGQLACRLRPAVVWGNDDQLARLFANLLDNAVKHGPPGGDIHLSVEDGLSGEVTVCVQDAGGKLPPEALPHLFDRFYRVDPSRSSATGGAGLGLSIARGIALRHGGDISIISSPNEGTRVRVRLPAMGGAPPLETRLERQADRKP